MYMNALGALMLAASTTTVATNLPPTATTNAPILQPVLATRAAAATLTNGLDTVDAMIGATNLSPVADAPVTVTNGMDAVGATPSQPVGSARRADRDPAAAPQKTPPAPANSPIAKMGETDEIKVAGLGTAELENVDAHTPTSVKLADPNAVTLDENTRVDITCEDATVADILRQFRKTVGANIISIESTNLQKRVSVRLNNAPWLPSLQNILSTRGFRLEPREGAYFVAENKEAAIPQFTRTYKLKHASAEELAELFNKSYGTIGPDGKVKKSVAIAYPSANVVIVTGEQKVLSDCESIIESVDEAVSQIYIEARFIELSTEALHKLGVQWNQLESWGMSASSLKAGFERNDGRLARYYQDKTSTMYTPKVLDANGNDISTGRSAVDYVTRNYAAGSITEPTGSGRTADDMNWFNARGFSGQLSADDFKIAMSAFEQMNDVKVFSNPKVVVSNGKEAKVDMTTKFPNVRVQATRNTSNGSDSFDISTQLEIIPGEDKLMFAKESFYSWGITLSVRPRVSPDGIINVEIIPTISQLDNTAVTQYTGFYKVSGGDSSAYSSYPVIDVKRITTDFTMSDGSTAVIGGLSKTTEEDVDSGIPYLRNIPWVGQKLFGWKSRQKMQKEIVVFVTLGIVKPKEMKKDVGLPKNAILSRQFVDGTLQEPGDRQNAAAESMKLDLTDMAKRNSEKTAPQSEVKPVSQPVAKPEPVAQPVAHPEPVVQPVAHPEPVGSARRADRAPVATPNPTTPPATKPEPVAKPATKPAPVAPPAAKPEPVAQPVARPQPAVKKPQEKAVETKTVPASTPAATPTPVAAVPAAAPATAAASAPVKKAPVMKPLLPAPEPAPVPAKKAPVMKPLLPAPQPESPAPMKKVTVMKPLLPADVSTMGPLAEKKSAPAPLAVRQPTVVDLLQAI